METWQEAALVAEVGNRAQVPIFSFATTSIAASLTSKQWPFLVRMNNNETIQMKCVAAIVGAYKWRNVITIYEDDTYGSNSGVVMLLSDALRDVGSQIEYRMVFPPISSLSDPQDEILPELGKLNSKQSRVFILVQPSLSFAAHLFREARRIGLMGRDSVWITTNTIASVLDSFNSSVISSMQGVLGIKTYFPETSLSFKDFNSKFRKIFHSKYPEEEHFEPGIYAVRAHDAISTLTRAMNNSTNTSKILLDKILSSNFTGLSGEIQFEDGELSNSPVFRIVNVAGKSYKELDFWTPECGFSESPGDHQCNGTNYNMEGLSGPVDWPGGLQRVPRGWVLPSDLKTMKIGVPGIPVFEEFVKVEENKSPNLPPLVTGFCVNVFEEAVKILRQTKYSISYEFVAFNGSYDDLILKVYNKEFDAVIGDITILASRSDKVEFTQPYTESGLTLIVPVKKETRAWMFMKPFTTTMWLVTGLVLVYTMLVVWFVEHQSNPDFRGPWKDQLSTALWFTFSTLFFAHREKLHSNFTRFVMVIWLFVVLVLTSSYTASLTSMLTVQRLEPTVSDIEYLKRSNSIVGCDSDSFVKKYLEDVLGFNQENIKTIPSKDNYAAEFEQGNIVAAFLELPGEKVFLSKYCNRYTTATETIHRFGGWGFVFPLGSALATDFSKAILELLENGNITKLEEDWLGGDAKCSKLGTEVDNESLGLDSFWGLFVLTASTSTIAFLLFLINLWRKYLQLQRLSRGNMSSSNGSRWHRVRTLLHQKGQHHLSVGTPASARIANIEDWVSVPPDCEYLSEYNNQGYHQASRIAEIEMRNTSTADL
ncbi:glutamate receptor 2.7-like [Macadamia integrifolia]|uniref:glutamate receptor 2.7-like n=1 Tax=Macadamia integrifolia TaxID=60698 RepID=UPI001C4EF971|nr:glutamate receptor 2.7-like [Macadamia integrifolia]XP_042501266.1 glutamate receptor 2.7-like [Macadamia integrifolia]